MHNEILCHISAFTVEVYDPLCGILDPNSARAAHWASFIGAKSFTKCDVYPAKSNFKTHFRG